MLTSPDAKILGSITKLSVGRGPSHVSGRGPSHVSDLTQTQTLILTLTGEEPHIFQIDNDDARQVGNHTALTLSLFCFFC